MNLSRYNNDDISQLIENLSIKDLQDINKQGIIKDKVTKSKLDLILAQIDVLSDMARSIIKQNQQNEILKSARCNFEKTVNGVYHFYYKNDELVCSIISPQEWGYSYGDHYGSFVLKEDGNFEQI